jgi:8-oxo-dGTP pyrophosphatase MutT (NUDIX family)
MLPTTSSAIRIPSRCLVWTARGWRARAVPPLRQGPRRGLWVAPGGKREPGGSLHEGAARETLEESGLLIETPELCVTDWVRYSGGVRGRIGRLAEKPNSPPPMTQTMRSSDLTGAL